jgi:hypothetical protein
MLLAMVCNCRTQPVLHPAYLLGLATILVRGYAPFIVNTYHWTAIVNRVIARAT